MFKFAQGICVFALAAVGVYAQTAPNEPVQETRTTGIVGIAQGQTARLNALNPGVASPLMGVPCSALLTFLDDSGNLLKSKTVSVAPGTSSPIVLDSVIDLALAVDQRREIRATITIPPVLPPTGSTTTAVAPVCELIGTLEIFNTIDGHTLVTLGAVHLVPDPVATPGG
jgi:hypothetical protein